MFVCWQGLVDNEWVTVPAGAAAQHIPLPSLTEPGSAGPFSLSDRHHLAAVLDAAVLVDVAIEPVAEPLWLGRDVADTVEFFTASGIGQTLLRDVDPATSTRVMAAVQAALGAHLASDGVRLASRAGSSPPATPVGERDLLMTKQRVMTAVVRQFGHPRGIGRHLAGWVMAHRPSNSVSPPSPFTST
jgi:hypothetical protein